MPALDFYNETLDTHDDAGSYGYRSEEKMSDPAAATLQAGAGESAEAGGSAPESVVIDTRFGEIEFQWDRAIYMPIGVLGFPEHHVFGLAHLPKNDLAQVKLLQCLTDPKLSFVVAPYNTESGAIAPEDLEKACAALAIPKDDVAVMLVVTVRAVDGAMQMTVNVQAPLLIDTRRQTGWQYVLPSERYSVQQALA